MLQAKDRQPTPEAGREKLESEKESSFPCASVTALQVKNAPVKQFPGLPKLVTNLFPGSHVGNAMGL